MGREYRSRQGSGGWYVVRSDNGKVVRSIFASASDEEEADIIAAEMENAYDAGVKDGQGYYRVQVSATRYVIAHNDNPFKPADLGVITVRMDWADSNRLIDHMNEPGNRIDVRWKGYFLEPDKWSFTDEVKGA